MKRSAAALVLALAAAGLASPALAAGTGGGGGGGTGGGGTGGGGGGTGGGGASVGSPLRTSAGAVCDGGSFVGVTLQKGFAKRVEVVMNAAGTFGADGTSSLGGTWELHLVNQTGGNELGAMSTGIVSTVPSFQLTWLTSNVPVGTSQISFVATRRDLGSTLTPDLPMTALKETCTATFTLVAR